MNQKLKFIGLLAILPLALVALTPDLIGEADAESFDPATKNRGDAFEERMGSTSNAGVENIQSPNDGDAFEERYDSTSNTGVVDKASEKRLASLEN